MLAELTPLNAEQGFWISAAFVGTGLIGFVYAAWRLDARSAQTLSEPLPDPA